MYIKELNYHYREQAGVIYTCCWIPKVILGPSKCLHRQVLWCWLEPLQLSKNLHHWGDRRSARSNYVAIGKVTLVHGINLYYKCRPATFPSFGTLDP